MSSVVAPGLTSRTGLTVDTCGMSSHFVVDASSVSAICVTGNIAPARVGRTDNSVEVRRLLRAVDDDRQHFADRRAAPAAFGERAPAAEHQQPAAALADEVGEHPELLGA